MLNKPHYRLADKFKFACHRGLACFNTCCQDISIYLTPYDVLRLKNSLNISSAEFLAAHTHILDHSGQSFPVVMLKMNQGDKRCPFVTPQGCKVYCNRPWSCRIAPVDILDDNSYSFCFDSSRCHGLNEQQEWTVQQWADNQGVDLEQKLERKFKDIPRNLKFTGFTSVDRHIKELFLLGCYNLDEFKRYVFESSFVKTFAVPAQKVAEIKADEVALMQFAFDWLTSGVDVRKTIAIRNEVFKV
jgi:Fe-S-cluster containining protein